MRENEYIARITNVKRCNDGNYIEYTIKGEKKAFVKKAKELAENSKELMNFSINNIRVICAYAVMEIFSPKLKIGHNSLASGVHCFEIVEISSGKKIKITPQDIYKNKKILRLLSPEDAFLVGYVLKEGEIAK